MPSKTSLELSQRLSRALGTDKPTKRRLRNPRNGAGPSTTAQSARIVSQLTPHPENPRKITDEQLAALKLSLEQFGDLSGLVFNRKTGVTVGGHQRIKLLEDAPITVAKRYDKPTKRGTVAEGYVMYNGERFVYREVEWTPEQEKAAMIAANKHGGDWDFPKLSDILLELDAANFDLTVTGFSSAELEKMVTRVQLTDEDETKPLTAEEINALPAHVRMVQLFLTTDTLPPFMEKVKLIGEHFSTANITDTVLKAVEECYNSHREDSPATDSKQRAKDGRSVQLDTASVGDKAKRRKKV